MANRQMTFGQPLVFTAPFEWFNHSQKTWEGPKSDRRGDFKVFEIGFKTGKILQQLQQLAESHCRRLKIDDITLRLGGMTYKFSTCYIIVFSHKGPTVSSEIAYAEMGS